MAQSSTRSVNRRRPQVLLSIMIILVLAVAAAVIAFRVSVWPSVWLLRATLDDGLGSAESNQRYVPAEIESRPDLVYDDSSPAGRLDVFRPAGVTGPLPTVVWVHGGGFIGGQKESLRPYLQVLASHGFVTVNVEYTHAPERIYPEPLRELAAALDHVVSHADELGVDPGQIVLAGDSAGASIAGQSALAITDDSYATAAGLPQPITADSLSAVALFSGPYDTSAISRVERPVARWFMNTVLWAYSGTKQFATDDHFGYVSLVDHVSQSYPSSFISTGPADPLLAHSLTLAERLTERGATVDALFFDPATTPETVGHEYAMGLSTPEGKQAMVRLVAFLHDHTEGPQPRGASADW